jgi:putative transposase
MSCYRHWKNYAQSGSVAFITTTVLDFVHVFDTPAMRERMVARILSDHAYYGATLHAFVVMSNHIHLLTRLPADHDVSWFVQRLKSNSAKEMLPLLTPTQVDALSLQSGPGRRSLWQASFRSVTVEDEAMFWQKVTYIHQNPVRAGLVDHAEGYAWSSAARYEADGWSEEEGVLSLGTGRAEA